MSEEVQKLKCSFCGKFQDQVRKLIAGPGGICICDECVELCTEIVEDELGPQEKEEAAVIPFAMKSGKYHVYIPPIDPSEFQEELTVSVTIRKSSK